MSSSSGGSTSSGDSGPSHIIWPAAPHRSWSCPPGTICKNATPSLLLRLRQVHFASCSRLISPASLSRPSAQSLQGRLRLQVPPVTIHTLGGAVQEVEPGEGLGGQRLPALLAFGLGLFQDAPLLLLLAQPVLLFLLGLGLARLLLLLLLLPLLLGVPLMLTRDE